MRNRSRFERFGPNAYSTHHILGISVGTAVGLAGAAGSIAGGMMQGNAAESAAGMSAEQARLNAIRFEKAGKQADGLHVGANRDAQRQLKDGFKRAKRAMRPYDDLGMQGSNQLAAYMGITPRYNADAPTRNLTPRPKREAYGKDKAGGEKYLKEVAAWKTKKTAGEAKYQTDLAAYEQGAAAHKSQYEGREDYGDYFKGYDVAEPTYKPYGVEEPKYQQFTGETLKADPLYQKEMEEGIGAWDRSAASRGSLMSGNTVAGLKEVTAAGIGRGRDRHVQDYGIKHGEWEGGRDNYIQDYGITHDEWEGGYQRDWNQDERKYNALAGLQNMGLGVRSGLADMRMRTADTGANMTYRSGGDRANSLYNFTNGAAGYGQQEADARATGRLAQGAAMGNAFGNIGDMAMLYGMGAYGGQTGSDRSPPRRWPRSP